MKKFFGVILGVFFIAGVVNASEVPDVFNLYLSSQTTTSGLTTEASGTSTMQNQRGSSSIPLNGRHPCWSVQMDTLTASQAQTGAGGTYTTLMDFDLYAEWSLDSGNWDNARKFYFFKDKYMAGASPYVVTRRLPTQGHIRFRFVTSGTTPFDYAKFIAIGGSTSECEVCGDILQMTAYPMNANSGISTHTVSNGARYVAVQYSGDGEGNVRHDGVAVSGSDGGFNLGSGYSTGEVIRGANSLSMNASSEVTAWVTEVF